MAPTPRRVTALQALRDLPAYLAREIATMQQLFDRYGDPFLLRIPGLGELALTGNPAYAKALFTASSDSIDANRFQRQLFGDAYGSRSVFLRDGPDHRRLRRMLLPPLRGDTLASYRTSMISVVERAVSRWPLDTPFPLLPETHRIGLEIILRVVMGIHEPAALVRWTRVFKRFLTIALSQEASLRFLGRELGALRSWRAFHDAKQDCDKLVYAEIASRRDRTPSHDVLQLLLEARDEAGEPMHSEEIRDQIMTLVLAGHETTATSSAWTMERLLRHQDALAVVRREASEGSSTFTTAAVYETLRLRAPLYSLARVTTAPFQLGECVIAPNTTAVVYLPVMHRNAALYPDPEAFRPQRFLDAKPDLWAWMPFGGGAHRCIGEHFSILEIGIIVQTILRKLELVATDLADEPIMRRVITHVPGHGCSVKITRRR